MRRDVIRAALAASAISAVVLGSAEAKASPCVRIAPDAEVLDARGRARIVEQLSASLAAHAIAVCADGDKALADVVFQPEGRAGVSVRVAARDEVTHKDVSRVVRIGAIPADGRPLALAVAADELLRAAWAEIALTRAPDPPPPPPPEVRAVVVASLPEVADRAPDRAQSAPTEARRFALGVAAAGEHATGGLSLGGVDVRFEVWVLPRLAIAARAGARVSPSVDSSDGSASVTALLGGLGATIALLPREGAFELDIPVRVDASRIQFSGHAAPGARASDASGAGVVVSAGALVAWRLAPGWAIEAEGTVGAVVRPVEADDGASAFTAFSGACVGAAIGIEARL